MLNCPLLSLIFSALASHLSVIETLTWSNYKKWKRDVKLALSLLDQNICLSEVKPSASNDDIFSKASFDKWERSNILSLMANNKWTISETIFGGISSIENAKNFLRPLAEF